MDGEDDHNDDHDVDNDGDTDNDDNANAATSDDDTCLPHTDVSHWRKVVVVMIGMMVRMTMMIVMIMM